MLCVFLIDYKGGALLIDGIKKKIDLFDDYHRDLFICVWFAYFG